MLRLCRGIILTVFSSLCVLSSSCAEERLYPCHRIGSPVVIDGKLDEEVWKRLPEAGGFYTLNRKNYSDHKQTFFRAGWDNSNIYMGITCDEPDIEKVKPVRKDGDKLICTEDSVEIFLCPKTPEGYFQFIVNTIGSRWNGKAPLGSYPPGNWEAKSFQGENYWSVEIKIPFSIVEETAPVNGERWRFNVCRNILFYDSEGSRYNTWAVLEENGFHDYGRFAVLRFERSTLSLKKARSTGVNISSDFIRFTRGFMENSLANLREGLSAISTGTPDTKNKVAVSRKVLLELEKICSNGKSSASEIWNALSKTNRLEKEIADLRIQQLFQ